MVQQRRASRKLAGTALIVAGLAQLFLTRNPILGIGCIAVGILLIGQGIWIEKKHPRA